MSLTLLRGLRMLEIVDFYGPVSVSQLARLLQADKATVSRMVSACEDDGWLVRGPDGVRVGPRSTMLGQGAIAATSLRAAEPLIHTVCGITGMLTQAVGLVGRHCVILASASASELHIPYGLTTRFPLWVSAASKVVASQLEAAELDRLLPDPFPSIGEAMRDLAPASVIDAFRSDLGLDLIPAPESAVTSLVSDRGMLDHQLEGIRSSGVFMDRNEILPGTCCIAVPWPRVGLAASLVCIATPGLITEREGLVQRVLRAAARPGASRDSIVAAAAGS